jgi:hypothetical protein
VARIAPSDGQSRDLSAARPWTARGLTPLWLSTRSGNERMIEDQSKSDQPRPPPRLTRRHKMAIIRTMISATPTVFRSAACGRHRWATALHGSSKILLRVANNLSLPAMVAENAVVLPICGASLCVALRRWACIEPFTRESAGSAVKLNAPTHSLASNANLNLIYVSASRQGSEFLRSNTTDRLKTRSNHPNLNLHRRMTPDAISPS